MSESPHPDLIARCACGEVELRMSGTPMTRVVCYCDDCQSAGRQLEALPHAGPVLDPDGGSAYVLYRKDRVECTRGADRLRGHQLHQKSATRRVFATCCNSALFLHVDGMGHWASIYRARLIGELPALEMRIHTRFKPDTSVIPSDVASYPRLPFRLIAKLIAARIAMLFGRNASPFVKPA